ncbi:MAG TPA: acyl-CoA dehydrogenase family protein [Solirubrobacteraceae bacterium]|nr:acyl-CoA dehydrogenase family protein [Solirubrobacteraceae bacterium]
MNLNLSDEQEFLREAARGALSRVKTVEAARAALEDESALPDLWPMAIEAGWPGLLVSEEHGGAGLGAYDALLVAQEAGRVLAPAPLLGPLPASLLLDRGAAAVTEQVAGGELKAAWLPARPPSTLQPGWTVDPVSGKARAAAPAASVAGDTVTFDGVVAWAPDAAQADVLVVIGQDAGGAPIAGVVEATDAGVSVEGTWRYDATRRLGTVTLTGATGARLDVSAADIAEAWYLTQALIAAESLGSVETALEVSLTYAKERFTFGRAIGSYQAMKHGLVEILRRQENTKSLLIYAGFAFSDRPDEIAYAASAARSVAGGALDFAARQQIAVHGGIGATWEHDAPLTFRRAQLSRRLVGGTGDATDRVAEELLEGRGPSAQAA